MSVILSPSTVEGEESLLSLESKEILRFAQDDICFRDFNRASSLLTNFRKKPADVLHGRTLRGADIKSGGRDAELQTLFQ